MANAKIISFVEGRLRDEQAERTKDVHALIYSFEDEIVALHGEINKSARDIEALADWITTLVTRLEKLEAGGKASA